MSYTVEVRADTFADDLTPHTFIVLTGPDGIERGWGFAPEVSGQMNGPGQVYENTIHAYSNSSGPMEITEAEFNRLQEYIHNTMANPPPYSLLYGSQCATWAVEGLGYAGLIPAEFTPDTAPSNMVVDFVESLVWNPYWQYAGFGIYNSMKGAYDVFFASFNRRDPLILDLDGDGVETIAEAGFNSVKFDYEGDGIKTPTGWVGADDGLLVLDRNGNGVIDNGSELFSDYTPIGDGTFARNGVDALRTVDSNADGIVNANDVQYANLRVWRDANQDGLSQANEQYTLTQLGISAINANTRTAGPGEQANGNVIEETITYSKLDGSTGQIGEVWFRESALASEFTDEVVLAPEAQALPQVQGLGMVRDLREAMSLDASGQLTALVQQFSTATTAMEQIELIDKVINAWADTSSMRVYDGGIYMTNIADNYQFDCRVDGVLMDYLAIQVGYEFEGVSSFSPRQADLEAQLGALQRFNGRYFFDVQARIASGEVGDKIADGYTSVVNVVEINGVYGYGAQARQVAALAWNNIAVLENAYTVLRDYVYQSLVVQTRLAPYYEAINVTVSPSGSLKLEFSGVAARFDVQHAADPVKSIVDLAEMLKFSGPELANIGWYGAEKLIALLQNTEWTSELGDALTNAGFTLQDAAVGQVISSRADDIIFGNASNETREGGAGKDILLGRSGNDELLGDAGNDVLMGGAGDDVLYGGAGDDILDGGAGNDHLEAHEGSDTFVFGQGYGTDTIQNFNRYNGATYQTSPHMKDVLMLKDLTADDVRVMRTDEHLDVVIKATGERIRNIGNFQYSLGHQPQIDEIHFSDGTVWSDTDIRVAVLAPTEDADILVGYDTDDTIKGAGGDDNLNGDFGHDTLDGEAGNDTLSGDAGNDVLMGGAGNDVLQGADGEDTLVGGVGNDSLSGYLGQDTYLFSLGHGVDTIADYHGQNIVRFDASVGSTDINATRRGNDLVLMHNNRVDMIVLENWYQWYVMSNPPISEVVFSDGTVWSSQELNERALTYYGTESGEGLYGSDSAETFFMYGGNDSVDGSRGNDAVYGGQGNDFLSGDDGDDLLQGEEGNDSLFGGYGNDTLNGGKGDDLLWGVHDVDVYVFSHEDGKDRIIGQGGPDVIRFDASVNAADITVVRDGNKLLLKNRNGTDQIEITGWYGAATFPISHIEFYDGTVLDAQELSELALTFYGTVNADTLIGSGDAELFYGNAGPDVIWTGDGNDTVYAGSENDFLAGQNGNDMLFGEAGEDAVYGDVGNDMLVGGVGNDALIGGLGDDVFVFNLGDGSDTVLDQSGMDVVRFDASVSVSDIDVKRAGDNLVLKNRNGTDQIVITQWYTQADLPIEQVEFGDGTVWNAQELAERTLTYYGTVNADTMTGTGEAEIFYGYAGTDDMWTGEGNDTVYAGDGNDLLAGQGGDDVLSGEAGDDAVYGDAGNDTLVGGVGNDALIGGVGDDVFVFNLGDGSDTVLDQNGMDVVRFEAGVYALDIDVKRAGDDLVLLNRNGTDQVVIAQWYTQAQLPIEQVEFGDGTVWNAQELALRAVSYYGTANADTLLGSADAEIFYGYAGTDDIWTGEGNDTVYAGDGNDLLAGQGGDDVLSGEAGDDAVYGDAGNDTLVGGDGNDALLGGLGDDAYVFSIGDGIDTIWEHGGRNAVRFDATVSASDIEVKRERNNLVLKHGNGVDKIVIDQWYASLALPIEQVEFSDGTVWNAQELATRAITHFGSATADTLMGSAEAEIFYGYDGTDEIWTGDGNDTVYAGNDNDLLAGQGGNDMLLGEAGDDAVYGDNGNDTLVGGAGNDALLGGAGDDVYLFSLNHGVDALWDDAGINVVRFDATINVGDIMVTRAGNDLLIAHNNGTDRVTVMDWFSTTSTTPVARVEFADGTAWLTADLKRFTGIYGTAGNDALVGTAADDSLYGLAGNDALNGGAGNDYLDGGVGSDTMTGGTGDDTYVVDVATDTIKENANAGVDSVLSSVTLTLGSDLENLTLTGVQAINGVGNGLNNIMVGTSSSNSLKGGAGNDVLMGAAGNDILQGGLGDDTYVLNRGHQSDVVMQSDALSATDTAQFGSDVMQNQLWFEKVGKDLQVSIIGTTDELVFKNWYSGTQHHVDRFVAGSGAVLLENQVDALVSAMAGFAPPPAGQLTLNNEQRAALDGVIAANWS